MKLDVALIGIGNIGFTYDMSKDNNSALSHVKAIYLHNNFNLKYIVDISDKYKENVLNFFPNAVFFSDWKKIKDEKFDILVIALPTNLHYRCLKEFFDSNIKYIIVEKPLFNMNEDIKLPDIIRSKIIINYYRRFEPKFIEIKNNIKIGIYGSPLKVINRYAKGLKHNGSHNIDLMNYFFENLTVCKVNILDEVIDYRHDDKTYDLFLKVKNNHNEFPIYFIGGNEKKFSIFEIELIFEKARIKIDDFGRILNISKVVNDPDYDGYKMLDNKSKNIFTNSKYAILNLYEYLYQMYKNNFPNISSYYDEQKNIKFIKKVYKEIECQN